MTRDTIFRVASMVKLITSVAALRLVEQLFKRAGGCRHVSLPVFATYCWRAREHQTLLYLQVLMQRCASQPLDQSGPRRAAEK
jgi:hypothetical protein